MTDIKTKLTHFFLESKALMLIIIPLTFIGITVSTILTGERLLRVLPLYVSLFIMLLNSGANRYGPLLGGLNSILYGFTYLHYRLYGSALQAFLVSFPIQILTFILWSKRAYKTSTTFRKMSGRTSALTLVATVLFYAVYILLMRGTDGRYIYLDGIIFVTGIVIPILTMLALVEYSYISLISSPVAIIMSALLAREVPEQIPYLIFNVYSFICTLRQCYKVETLFNEQRSALTESQDTTT